MIEITLQSVPVLTEIMAALGVTFLKLFVKQQVQEEARNMSLFVSLRGYSFQPKVLVTICWYLTSQEYD